MQRQIEQQECPLSVGVRSGEALQWKFDAYSSSLSLSAFIILVSHEIFPSWGRGELYWLGREIPSLAACMQQWVWCYTAWWDNSGSCSLTCNRWSDDGWLLCDSSLEPVRSPRRLSSCLWWLGVEYRLWPHVSTSDHYCLPQHSQAVFSLRRPTHHPAAAACARNDRGLWPRPH